MSVTVGVNELVPDVALITQSGQVVDRGSLGRASWLVATMIRYDVAPGTEDQVNVGCVGTFSVPVAGIEEPGAGKVGSVAKPAC